jgi:hypothetical protein
MTNPKEEIEKLRIKKWELLSQGKYSEATSIEKNIIELLKLIN